MPNAKEAKAYSPQNPKEESPAGNPDTGLSLQTRGGATSRQPQCWTPLTDQRSHQLCQLPQKHLILNISRPTCTTYFLITTKFYHSYMHLLIFPIGPLSSFQTNAIAMALGSFLFMH